MRIADRDHGAARRPGGAAPASTVTSVDLDGWSTAMLGVDRTADVPAERSRTGRRRRLRPPAVDVPTTSACHRGAAGEIVGLAGLQGAGHLDGAGGAVRPGAAGRVSGAAGRRARSRAAVRAGTAFVPSDRKRYGLMLDKPVWQNTSAVGLAGPGPRRPVAAPPRPRLRPQRSLVTRLRISGDPGRPRVEPVRRQPAEGRRREVAGRRIRRCWCWTTRPAASTSARGRRCTRVIAAMAAEGKPVLLASTDLAELCELCDRVAGVPARPRRGAADAGGAVGAAR